VLLPLTRDSARHFLCGDSTPLYTFSRGTVSSIRKLAAIHMQRKPLAARPFPIESSALSLRPAR